MRLRTRLACLILILLFIPILSMSLISLDYIVGQMIDDLSHSTDLVVDQVFEQIRDTLMKGGGTDLPTELKDSKSLARLLNSTQAFAPSVVSASVVGLDGNVIVAANDEGEGKPAPVLPPLSQLAARSKGWLLFASIPSLVSTNVYESRREVIVDNKPAAIISIGVTTAMVADKARHLLLVILLTAAAVTAIAWLAISLVANRILFQVAALSRGIEQLAAGRTPVEVEVEGRDELSALAEKFNELSRQVRSDRSRLDTDQAHLFDIVRSIQDSVILLDAQGLVLFANRMAREKLTPRTANLDGVSLEAALGRGHPIAALVKTTFDTGTEAHDVPVQMRDGSMLVSFFRMGQGPKTAGLLLVMRDLKQVMELEGALDTSIRLAHLGTLISGMAHQLRSPLHGMNLRLELLRDDHGEGASRHIDKLRQDVTRLDQAIEAILRFTRPADLKITDFSINELLAEIGTRVKTERIEVEYNLTPGFSAVRADKGMIAEAFTNLVTNSVQAMPHGGKLTLTTRPKDATIEIEVADQGIGIPKDKLDRIFDLYYTTKPGGSGLGLPFAMRAIELNHGKIQLSSEVAQGTICTIVLPMAENASPRPIAGSAA